MDPEILGRYDTIKQIGSGGIGDVFYAYDRFQQKFVAIKKIKHTLRDYLDGTLLQYEFDIISKIKDPYLIRVYDLFMLPYNLDPFFTMEYIEGLTYDTMLDKISFKEHLNILIKVLRALDALHKNGILHLDFKPSNIMIRDRNREPVLMDFGLSRLASANEIFNIQGTKNFMAPEIVEQKPIGKYTDIYSAGVSFYKILTGKFPYSVVNYEDICKYSSQKHYPEPNSLNKHIPDDINQLILKMLEYRPEDRIADIRGIINIISYNFDNRDHCPGHEDESHYLYHAHFTGRESEIKKVKSHFSLMSKKEAGAILFIHGGEGTGKSRFINEIKYFLQSDRFLVLRAKCLKSIEGSYYVLTDILLKVQSFLQYLIKQPDDAFTVDTACKKYNYCYESQPTIVSESPQKNKNKLPIFQSERNKAVFETMHNDLRDLVLEYNNPINVKSSMDKIKAKSIEELYYRTFNVFRHISCYIKLCIILEDIDKDMSIMSFSKYFIRSISENKQPDLFLVLSSTCSARTNSLKLDRNNALSINLKPFSPEETSRFISTMLGHKIAEGLSEVIFEKTGGGPAQTQELLRYLFYKKHLIWKTYYWGIKENSIVRRDLKGSIRDIIVSNLLFLRDSQKHILYIIAVSRVPLIKDIILSCLCDYGNVQNDLDHLEEILFLESCYLITGHKTYNIQFSHYKNYIESLIPEKIAAMLLRKLILAMIEYYFASGTYPEIIAILSNKAGLHIWTYLFSKRTAKSLIEKFSYSKAKKYIDQANSSFAQIPGQKTKNMNRRLHKLNNLYLILHHKTADKEKFYHHLIRSMELIYSKKHPYRLLDNLIHRFSYYLLSQNLIKAKLCQKKAMPLAKRISYEKYAMVLGNYSVALLHLEEFNKLDVINEELEGITLMLGDKVKTGIFYLNKGIKLRLENDLEGALKNYKKGLNFAEEAGSPYLYALSYGNISTYYFYRKNYNEACDNLQKAIEYYLMINDFNRVVFSMELLIAFKTLAEKYKEIENDHKKLTYYYVNFNITRVNRAVYDSHCFYLFSLLFSLRIEDLNRAVKQIPPYIYSPDDKYLINILNLLFSYYAEMATLEDQTLIPDIEKKTENRFNLLKKYCAYDHELWNALARIVIILGKLRNRSGRSDELLTELDFLLQTQNHDDNMLFHINKKFLIMQFCFDLLYYDHAEEFEANIVINIISKQILQGIFPEFMSVFLNQKLNRQKKISLLISLLKEMGPLENKYQFSLAERLFKKTMAQ